MSQQPTMMEAKKKDPVVHEQETAVDQSNMPQALSEPAKQLGQGFSGKMAQWRNSTILATPAFIVNNSSNLLGASHVLTEMLMFKSGMKGANLIDNPGNPINWVKEPFQKIKADILTRGAAKDFSLRQLFQGNVRENFKTYLFDTHAAGHRELGRQVVANAELRAAEKAAKSISFGNPWQTRTTAMGLAIWSLSTLIPERKESDQEIEHMAQMRTLHPFQYIGTRLKQAVWFPDWTTHKREMLGLGYLGIGILSGLGSWRNRGDLAPELKLTTKTPAAEVTAKLTGYVEKIRRAEQAGEVVAKSVVEDVKLIEAALAKGENLIQGYKFNKGYFATAVVSFLAGLPLLFALDERKAYSTYGSLSLLRIPALPSSLYSKMHNREPGWLSYTIGKLTFQVEDFLFSLIGGATKNVHADGTIEIIDHEQLKKNAIAGAKRQKEQERLGQEKHLTPSTGAAEQPTAVITDPSTPLRAMPERAAQAAANDAQMEMRA